MNENFPVPILDDKDLIHYENFINEIDKPNDITNFSLYLKNHIGKMVKVEMLVCNHLERRFGVLWDIGTDFLVLKIPDCQSLIINGAYIQSITVAHDSDIRKLRK